MSALPPLAPFPKASWQKNLSSTEWNQLVQAWASLCRAYLDLPDDGFSKASNNHDSLVAFTSSFVRETVHASSTSASTSLLRPVFHLTSRLLKLVNPPQLLEYSFLGNLARLYPKKRTAALLGDVFAGTASRAVAEASVTALKRLLIPHLDSGIRGDLKLVESSLVALNPLLHASPAPCVLLLAGSDFLDGLVTCYRVMNPPLRKAIVATTYLCVVGLADSEPPKWSMLNDQLFALNSAAESHKNGPLNANDSLVAELVTTTPLLKILWRKAEAHGAATESLQKRIAVLESFTKGPMTRPSRLVRGRVDKGKGKATNDEAQMEAHVRRMSQVSQVQDIFPELGTGFISRCLDEYGDDVEQVVANLLSNSLPSHLAAADRSEPLSPLQFVPHQTDVAARSAPLPPAPAPAPASSRRNVFDDDEFDRLGVDLSKISFGKKPQKDADHLLRDKSAAPNKATILSALAAFDSDEDERDDTYDAADVGGTVDSTNQEADGANDGNEELLFRAYQTNEKMFDRDAGTRRSNMRLKLREETGMTDEALEGWAVMLARNPQQKKRLEAKYAFAGQQAQLERTAWRAGPAEDGDVDGAAGRGGRGGRGGSGEGTGAGRGGRGRGGRGGPGSSAAGPAGEKETEAARRNKEAHKGSRANHNRRNARAKKMARGGFAG
ncbi:uncharacterized protein UV8b_07401 [Ustilaginoidea virens]|uniref:CUE domain-containing protein n=1 Tax=Ustilaginoidea virens TaxID=1159556 RepID=A0A8E5HXE9_USTVR|nr:uncharacterized protein UV8b_07401 [Ustilaginoidea virens]QUC23160.1 hypothetical protein UV8b_07401 [Ustilaginoidea virens]